MLGKKVVLIHPPNPFLEEPAMNPQLGLCYIAGVLKGKVELKGIDFCVEEFSLDAIPLDADFYGVYCSTSQFKWAVQIIKFLKRETEAIVIVGGPHATTIPSDFLDCRVDTIVRGEAESIIGTIIASKFVGYTDLRRESHLDDLPLPHRELFGLDNYRRTIHGENAIHIITARGCPYECHFCDKVTTGNNVRMRSVEGVFREVDYIRDKHGINSFVVYDDTFTLVRSRVRRFCKGFAKRESKWRVWARADTVTVGMLREMKDSGLTNITYGIESGDDDILRKINKRCTREDNKSAILWAKEVGIPVRANLMYGNPGETKQSVDNTIKLIEETQPEEWNLAVLSPVPGSDFWNHPGRYGLRFDADWLRDQEYEPCNRFGTSGVGDIWIEIDSMSRGEFVDNLKYMLNRLEEVCPRKKVQDTIQTIDQGKIQ